MVERQFALVDAHCATSGVAAARQTYENDYENDLRER
jgi:hypothetical protein